MRTDTGTTRASRASRAGRELIRYVINGLVATFVNWAVMRLCLDVIHLPWAWLAYWIGALVGISVSFLGNRYFVFRRTDGPIAAQAAKFLAVYAAIALLVSGIMAVWSDWWHYDTNVGFVLATGVQVALSYVSNKVLVFR
jgi:putative flippase GtrA